MRIPNAKGQSWECDSKVTVHCLGMKHQLVGSLWDIQKDIDVNNEEAAQQPSSVASSSHPNLTTLLRANMSSKRSQ